MSKSIPRLSVIGLGKLGSPMAACFAAKGFEVVGVDLNQEFVDAINDGRAPVFEPQLQETIDAGRERLRATTDARAAVAETDVTFMIVPTPSGADGTFSLDHILKACEDVGAGIRGKDDYHVVVITSTVMPGSTEGAIREALERASGRQMGDFGLIYSPEFIALGSVIRNFLNPDFLLVGESDERAGDLIEHIYAQTVENGASHARMNFVNAELAKISVNTYITTKITFANMIARICERLPGADVDVVADALGRDTRIGRKYLTGAIAYGGPCFPRDNVALGALARSLGAPATLAEATDRANREETDRLADLVETHLPERGSVAVLGLSYKPHTNVVEESPGVYLARELALRGHQVTAYDPAATENARRAMDDATVDFATSTTDAIADADVVVVTTPWPEFSALPASLARGGRRRTVIDCWRMFDRAELIGHANHVALGEGAALRSEFVR